MRDRRVIIALATVAAVAGLYLVWPLGGAAVETTKKADFTLYDETGGDVRAVCKGDGRFEIHIAVRAINADAIMRVKFQDDDFVDYPIPQDTSYSVTQAAGTSVGVDRKIIIKSSPSSTGQLVGWVSASTLGDKDVGCTSVPS
jgi:hypothetical protein